MKAWDEPVRRARAAAPPSPAVLLPRDAGPLPVELVVEVMLRRSGWTAATRDRTRELLLEGRFARYRSAHAIETIDQLTDDHVAEFYAGCRAAGLAPSTLMRFRQAFVGLERFCASTSGYGAPLAATERLAMPRIPARVVQVLSPADEIRVLKAARHQRDRLVLEVMLTAGVRIGELVALQLADLQLDERHPHLVIRRSGLEDMTKNSRDRIVPLNWAGGSLSRRLARYLERDRPESHRPEVFLSLRGDGRHEHHPLTHDAVRALLNRIGKALGLKLYPHLLRHTWATRAANAGVPMPLLQEAGGWSSLTMVRRYYTADRREMLEAFARAHRGG